MTETQTKIIEKVQDTLAEHFPAYVLAVAFDDTQPEDKKQYTNKAIYWHGGAVHAYGIAAYATKAIEYRCFTADEP